MDDELASVLARVAGRDRAAFRELYAATSGKLFGVALRILGQRAEAEDALQEIYTRVWLRADRYDPARGRVMTWLIAIARNHAIDRLRSRPQESADADAAMAVADAKPGPLAGLVAEGEARRLVDCFSTLEDDRARAVRGAYLDGLSYDALARRHAVPLNTMRTWLRRSLLRLKECMAE